MTWNGLGCSWCGLVVGHVSLCCSVMVVVLLGLWVLKPVVPIVDGRNGETARGWRSQASMLSPSQCVSKLMEARAQSIHYNSIWVGKLFTGASILALSHCMLSGNCYTWTCVPWVCRPCALDKIFFWWPARVTPILDNSLQGRQKRHAGMKHYLLMTLWKRNIYILQMPSSWWGFMSKVLV